MTRCSLSFLLHILLVLNLRAQSVSIPIIGCNCGPDSKYNFLVTLPNDSIIKIKSRVERQESPPRYFLTMGQGEAAQRLYPAQTKLLVVTDYTGYRMMGFPTDTAWLFHTDTGKINMYATVPVYQTDNITAIRQGIGGPMLPATLQNLLPMLQGDEKAISIARKGKLQRAARLYNIGEN